jgi:hypothetical protein
LLGACLLTLTVAAGCDGDESNNATQSTGGSAGAGVGGGTTTGTDTGATGGGGAGGMTTTTTTTTPMGGAGGGGGSGGTGNNGMPSDMYPAPHPAPPHVVTLGGPVLANPKIVPIFFANDDAAFTAKLADFTNKVGSTNYWSANVSEYGVGPAVSLAPVQAAEKPSGTIDDSQIQSWLASKLNSNDPAFPPPDKDTLYALYYPKNVTITLSGGGPPSQSCTEFGGYHSNLTLDAAHGNMDVAYSVVPHCPGFQGQTELETATSSASHEYIEAATDPFPQTEPAYGQVDNSHIYWLFALGGGEIGDMCAQQQSSFVQFPELDYVVQRSWSNKSANAGHDPCVPALAQPYFNSAPVLPDTISLNVGQVVKVKGVQIPAGQSKTIEVDLFSDAKTAGPWTVSAVDLQALQGGQPELGFSFDKSSGVNGEKLNLTIKVIKASQYKAEIFFLTSKLGNQQNLWIGLVGN